MNKEKKDGEILRIIKPLVKFWENSREPWWVKNAESQFVYANKRLCEFLGLPKGYNPEGRYDGELPVAISEFEAQFQAHDRMVQTARDRITSIVIQQFNGLDYLQPYYADKIP